MVAGLVTGLMVALIALLWSYCSRILNAAQSAGDPPEQSPTTSLSCVQLTAASFALRQEAACGSKGSCW